MASSSTGITHSKVRSFRYYKWLVMALLSVLAIINFADKAIIGFAAVPIMKDLGLTHEQFGLVGSSFFWFFSLSALVAGRLADKIPTKSLLTGIASIWALVQFATIFVGSLGQLAATRVILGAAEGPSYNLSAHSAAKWLPQSQRGFGFSLLTTGSALGPALAAPILIYVIYHFGWRSAFALLGVIGVIWVVAWSLLAKDSPESAGMKLEEQTTSSADPEVTSWRRLIPAIFSRDFILVALVCFASYWGLAMLIVWVPPYLEEVRHITHTQAQLYEGLPWLFSAIVSLITCAYSDHLFRRTHSSRKSRVYMMGLLGIAAAVCWYLFINVAATGLSVTFLVAAVALTSPGYALGTAIVSDMVLPEHRGTMLGILVAVMTSAGLVAPAVSGVLIQASGSTVAGYASAFLTMAALYLIATVLVLVGVHPPKPGTLPRYARKMMAASA